MGATMSENGNLEERIKIVEDDFKRYQDGIFIKITSHVENICLAVETGDMSINNGYEAIHALYSVFNGYDKDDFLINVLSTFKELLIGKPTDTVSVGPYHVSYLPSESRILISDIVKSIPVGNPENATIRFKNVIRKLREKYDS